MQALVPWSGLPGIRRGIDRLFDRLGEIEVVLQDKTLTISGEKKAEKEEKGRRYYCKERTYGAFTRSIRLPGPVDPGKVEARLKNGVLTVTLARAAAARGPTIPIKAAA